ncbi:beta-lactamase/transpeptidase-like protein [Mycena metata]|uniref:Beta-lactamase/transpeptidase-like protein n=1 Tax=Mycena metata TaxID=1033252 RepID=A0AAD7JY00_9AGAR|nr:beta-lactamase/transpeptidase-like protein [Mycena metata]
MRFLIPLTGLFSFSLLASARVISKRANNTQILNPDVDAFITNLFTEWNSAAGAAVAVARRDAQGNWLVETKGYGAAKADGTKVDENTIFAIGSNSKLFDVLATGLLISNESLTPQISWTTKISSLIPNWKLMDAIASSESTIADLMSHRTGLPAHDFGFFLFNDTFPAVIERLQYLKPSLGFRDAAQYNNIMYAILSYLPTALLPNKPLFARYVKEHIIDRLGLNSTTYSFAIANATGTMADGFAREAINITENPLGPGTTRVLPFLFPTETEDGSTISGAGGLLSTATDMARWLQMLISNGQHPTKNATIVPAAVFDKLATGVTVWVGNDDFGQFPGATELSPAVYSGAQSRIAYRGHDMLEHEGALPGYHSRITRFPFDNAGIAILTNDDAFGPLLKEVIKFRLADEILGLEPIDWNSRYQAAAQEIGAAATSTAAPANASLPFSLSTVLGTYRNLGYGADIELCGTAAGLPPVRRSLRT